MNTISDELKKIIENNPIVLATVMFDGKPNVITVAGVEVVNDHQILITDNYMQQTVHDIKSNPNIAIAAWTTEVGYKIIGTVTYFTAGPWRKRVQAMSGNAGYPAKGALLVEVTKIIKSI